MGPKFGLCQAALYVDKGTPSERLSPQRLYLTDAKSQRIWALDSRDRRQEPTVFLDSDSLENPATLAVAPNGTLWLGTRRRGQAPLSRALRSRGSQKVDGPLRSVP